MWAIGQFEVYLIDAPFTVVTDHAPLQWLPTKRLGNSRLQRWALALSEFTFTVEHRSGTKNNNADALSRCPVPNSAPIDESNDPPLAPGEIAPHFVRSCYVASLPFRVVSSVDYSPTPYMEHRHNLHVNRTRVDYHAPSAAVDLASSEQTSVGGIPWTSSSSPAAPIVPAVPATSSSSAPVVATAHKLHPSPQSHRKDTDPEASISLVDENDLQRFVEAQWADAKLTVLISYLRSGKVEVPRAFDVAAQRHLVTKGLNHVLLPVSTTKAPGDALYYFPAQPRRGLSSLVPLLPRLVVPTSYHRSFIQMAHDAPFSAHLGIRRTYRRLATRYYWETMLSDITAHVKSCQTCTTIKTDRQRIERPLGGIPAPTRPFEFVAIDFLGPFKKSGDFQYILVIIDHFTRWAITIPTYTQRAETVAMALVDELYNKFGVPTRLLSDRGSDFRSALIVELHKYLHVKQLFTSAHHPQTNGMVERFNSTLKDMLASLAVEFGSQWVDVLQSATFAYNTSYHGTIGMTPYYCLFGREAITPGDALAISASMYDESHGPPEEPYNRVMHDNLRRAQDFVSSLFRSATAETLRQRQAFARIPMFNVGDRVLLRHEKADSRVRGNTANVQPFSGPWIVRNRRGQSAYEIEFVGDGPKRHLTTVNIDRLKAYHDRESRDQHQIDCTEPLVPPHPAAPVRSISPSNKYRVTKEPRHSVEPSVMPHLKPRPQRSGIGAVDGESDSDDISPHSILPQVEQNEPAIVSTPVVLPTLEGPGAAARERHANHPTPLYSDAYASRAPARGMQDRYSLARRPPEVEPEKKRRTKKKD